MAYDTQDEAILVGIQELQRDGGGQLDIHEADCQLGQGGRCTCEIVLSVQVPPQTVEA